MILQTNLIGRLTAAGYRVAIVSPDATDENLVALSEDPGVDLIEWQSKSTLWDDDYLYKRMYYLEDINKNVALKEKFYNGLFFSTSLHPWKRIRPLFYYIIFRLGKMLPSIRKNFLVREGKHLVSAEASGILERIQPKMVISTYPVSIIEAKLLYAAQKMNIPTLQQLLSWDNITCKGKFPVMADRYIVWGDIMYEELQEYYGIADARITKCGVPHFDAHIQVREQPVDKQVITSLGLSAEDPYLFFAMSSPRFAPNEIAIVEWLSRSVEENAFGQQMQMIIRPHPQNVQSYTAKGSWIERLDKLSSSRVAVDYPLLSESNLRWAMKKNDMIRLSQLIAGCLICLNSGSTVSIDALMHNKPVILTSFDGHRKYPYWNSARRLVDYTHLKKFVAEGGAVSVNSYPALQQTILDYMQDPDHDLSNRRNALLRECYKDDGQSTERVVQSISSTLSKIA